MGYRIPPPPDPAERVRWERGVLQREAADAAHDARVIAAAHEIPAVAEPMRHHRRMVTYLDMGQIGALFDVSGGTVSKWRTRYADDHPCPEPDAMTGQTPGWRPEREGEWRAWHADRPGQGAAGRPKPRRAQPE